MPFIDLPPDWWTRFTEWARDLLPVSQLAAVVLTALIAWTAFRSASAARFTSKRADETARRSAEALGRATQPTFLLMIRSSEDAIRGTEPVELTAQILGTSPHPARDVSIRLERTDGHPSPVITERPAWIGPSGGRASSSLGLVPRRTPEPDLNVEARLPS